jgi:hypothetical protein
MGLRLAGLAEPWRHAEREAAVAPSSRSAAAARASPSAREYERLAEILEGRSPTSS